ncbi:folylpolyglutamate synthase/dihydrofolate synthase family protein [Magnetospira sp. QH-2]|uniref:bifunctional folylpolyglutamate synthase/dihydrofolate synthase n=1 Tax=Magnetospira sp. (strain QH-2) TaxID=1288970 RepID=UPI0003E81575|nr:folylpolyglutamate synthase/dihydrofolate synthase family protein [Magnetospira sp. QH-2]CCQ72593.1 Folylpolyglutamate synthase [Magnetospira sp. QH-2]
MTSDAVLERLNHLHPKLIDLSLDRVVALLERLGNPHHDLPPVVHVAGTNGKGSVIAFMRAILEAAGLRVHVYTSPHLIRFHERIRVAGQLIAEEELRALLEECEAANGDNQVTFFEITTAAAFLAFSRTPADVVLLETGLGGRLDATNVINEPALTVLTPISMDHESFLGHTIGEIVEEKMGILKPGVPCVCAKLPRGLRGAAGSLGISKGMQEQCREMGISLIMEGEQWGCHTVGEEMIYKVDTFQMRLPQPGLAGAHQVRNAAQAVAAVEVLQRRLNLTIPEGAFGLGMKTVDWPGRLERLKPGALSRILPDEWELWVDGGHNPSAAKALAGQIRHWRDKPLYLVLGMMAGKDTDGFLKNLKGRSRVLRCVTIPGEDHALPAETLAELANAQLLEAETASSVAEALTSLTASQPGPARILICGSLYLAGQVLAANG